MYKAKNQKLEKRFNEFHGFLPFLSRICALISIPVEPIAPRIREGSPQPSKAGVARIFIRGKTRLETRLTPPAILAPQKLW